MYIVTSVTFRVKRKKDEPRSRLLRTSYRLNEEGDRSLSWCAITLVSGLFDFAERIGCYSKEEIDKELVVFQKMVESLRFDEREASDANDPSGPAA